MNSREHRIDTRDRRVVDVTELVEAFCSSVGRDGLVNVFVPHATAGVALMEIGSGSEADLEEFLERILPRDDRYRHQHGSVGHGADHLLPVVVAPSMSIPVDAGRLALGTWQRVVVVDTNRENDQRRLRLTFVPG
jgi:secondary thiamine-phosphate synthase enzyme